MKTARKCLAMLLVILMMTTLLPVASFAEETPTGEETFVACTVTEGCTLAAGHEGDCIVQEAKPTPTPTATAAPTPTATPAPPAPTPATTEPTTTEAVNEASEAVKAFLNAVAAIQLPEVLDDTTGPVLNEQLGAAATAYEALSAEELQREDVSAAVKVMVNAQNFLTGGVNTLVSGVHENQQVKFRILYVDSSYNVGYNYGPEADYTSYVCQYAADHSDGAPNHTVSYDVAKAAADAAQPGEGWKITGWYYGSPHKNIGTGNSFTKPSGSVGINIEKKSTIWLIANKTAPQMFNLTVNSTPITVSPLTGGGQYAKDATANISAPATYNASNTDNIVQVFTGWTTASGGTIGNAASAATTYKMPGTAATVTANYVEKADTNNNGIPDEDEQKYNVTYTDGVEDETVFEDKVFNNVLKGTTTPAFGEDPTRDGYVFGGWNPTVAATVTADATYVAQWDEDKNGNGIPDDEEPTKPRDDELNGILSGEFVTVDCVNAEAEHADKTYGLLADSYTVSDPVYNAEKKIFTCVVSVAAEKYVDAYNAELSGHALIEGEKESFDITLTWDDNDNKWTAPAGYAVTFAVECKAAETFQPVYLAIYRNGDKTTPYKYFKLADVLTGSEYDLSELPGILAENYSSQFGYEYDGFYNDGWWKFGDKVTVTGYTNIKVVVTDYEKVVVKGTIGEDKTTAWTIFDGKALHGTNLLDFLAEQGLKLDKDHYSHDEWFKYDWPAGRFSDKDAVTGWTNVMVKYTPNQENVNLVIYRNGDTSKAYKTVSLGTAAWGSEYALSELPDILAANYSSQFGYVAEGFYNDGGWNQYKGGNKGNVLGSSITINGWTNIYVMVTDYEKVMVMGTIGEDKATEWTIFDGKALHGTNLLDFLAEQGIKLDKDHYSHDEWFKYDWPAGRFTDKDTVSGWTNVMVKYTPNQETVNLVIYRNGDTSKAYKTVSLGTAAWGSEYDLSGLLGELEANYSSDHGFEYEGFYNDGGWNQYKGGNKGNVLGSSITINGWTNIYVMVTDYEKVMVMGTIGEDKTTEWTIFDGKALHGTNLLDFLAEQGLKLDKDHYSHDEWFKYDWPAGRFTDKDTVSGWTNVMVKYTPNQETVNLVIYRNGDTSKAYKTVSLGTAAWGSEYDLSGLLGELEANYSSDHGFEYEGFYNDGGWNQYKAGDPGNKLGDSLTVNGWTNIHVMVWDRYPVYANIYADNKLDKPVISVDLGVHRFGTSFRDILTEKGILTDISGLNQKDVLPAKFAASYDWNGIWSHEASNIPNDMTDRTVNGWTNLCTMVYNNYPVNYHIDGELVKTEYINVNTLNGYTLYAPEKDGYSFDGWYESEKDVGNPAKKVATPLGLKKYELYGTYVSNELTLTYVLNGGTGGPDPLVETAKIDPDSGLATFTVSSVKPVRAGYAFKGWQVTWNNAQLLAAADEGQVFQPGDAFMTGIDVTLTAIWDETHVVTLSYDANGGKHAPGPQSYETTEDSVVAEVSMRKPYRWGYYFQGWSLKKDGPVQYKPGWEITLTGDTTLYAVWQSRTDAPMTGDTSNIALWATLASLSVVAAGAAVVIIKKKGKNE